MSKTLKIFYTFIILSILLLGGNTVYAVENLYVVPQNAGNPSHKCTTKWIGDYLGYIFTIENLEPNPGYTLRNVTVNGREAIIDGYVATDTYLSYRDPTNIYVNYDLINYDVSFVENNATISGLDIINVEATNKYTITPNDGYILKEVLIGTENVLTEPTTTAFEYDFSGVNNFDAVTITANAELIKYDLVINDGANSSNNADFNKIASGDSKKVVIIPEKGYKLTSVKVNGVSQFDDEKETAYTVELSNVTENQTIDVTTAPIEYTITVIGENVTHNAPAQMIITDKKDISINAEKGYLINKVLVNGEETELKNSILTLENITQNIEIKVETEKEKYEVLNGKDQKIDGENELVVRFSGDYSLFRKLYINDIEVNKKYYKAESGSTIVKLSREYIAKLSNGIYTIKAEYENGNTAETIFTLAKIDVKPDEPAEKTDTDPISQQPEKKPNPKTGDKILIVLVIMILAILGVIISFNVNKKKKEKENN